MDNIEQRVAQSEPASLTEQLAAPDTESKEKAMPKTALEFEFSEEIGGLTFTEEVPISSPAEEERPEPQKTEKKPLPEPKAEEPRELRDEFILPAGFRSSPERSFSQDKEEEPYRPKGAYVPTFTSASENYRIRGATGTVAPEKTSLKKSEPVSEGALDPTAEIGGSSEVERVVVTLGTDRIEEPVDENITIYKFNSPEELDTERRPIPTAEELMARFEEEREAEIPEEEPVEEPIPQKGEYRMPDPTDSENGDVYRSGYFSETYAPKGAHSVTGGKWGLHTPEQRDAMKDRFLDTFIATRIRLISSLLLLFAAVLFELFSAEAVAFLGFGGSLVATLLIDSQLCLCMLLIALPEAVRGVRYAMRKKAVPELMLITSCLAVAVYTLVAALSTPTAVIHFSVLLGLQTLICITSTLCRVKADYTAFRIVTKNAVKQAVDVRRTRELPRENIALDGRVDEFRSLTARVFEVGTLSDFKENTDNHAESSYNVLLCSFVSLGLALVTAVVSYFVSGWSLVNGATAFALVLIMTPPAASLLLHKLPLLHAARRAGESDSAFVGEGALSDSAAIDVLCYDDTEVFGREDVTVRKVHLYGKAYNMTKAMQQMYALFSVVGGPLGHVFGEALDRKCESATAIRIESDGVSGIADGHPVCAGTEAYMRRHGIRIPDSDGRGHSGVVDSSRIMYGASDGDVYVKFYLRYSFSEEFSMLLPHIKAGGIVPLIYTCDPNINIELLRVLTFGEDIIRVMKKNTPATLEVRKYNHISSGLITLGDKTDVFGLLLLGRSYSAFQRSMAVVELGAILVGGVCAAVISLIGAFNVPAIALAAWHAVLGIGLFIKSRLTFGGRKTER